MKSKKESGVYGNIWKVIGFVAVNQQRLFVVASESNKESSVCGRIWKVIGFVAVNQQRLFVVARESNKESSVCGNTQNVMKSQCLRQYMESYQNPT
jgi:hypothetical protein